MIKVKNTSNCLYMHSVTTPDKGGKLKTIDYCLKPQSILDVPEEIANIWLKTKDVVEYVEPKEAKAEKEALEKENAELKAKIQELEAAKGKKLKK